MSFHYFLVVFEKVFLSPTSNCFEKNALVHEQLYTGMSYQPDLNKKQCKKHLAW